MLKFARDLAAALTGPTYQDSPRIVLPEAIVGETGPTGPTGATGAAGAAGGTLLGTITIAEGPITVTLAGVRKVTISTPAGWGVVTGINLAAFPTASLSAGYEIHSVVATGMNQIQVGVTVPILSLGSYSFTCRLVRINT